VGGFLVWLVLPKISSRQMWYDKKVGILGGGQLGAMLIRSAIDLGLDISVMDGSAEAPCARYSSKFTQGSLMDYDAVMAFGENLDVLTIEIEAVNVQAMKDLEAKGVKVFPSPRVVELIQDKWTQKTFLQEAGIPVVPGVSVMNRAELAEKNPTLPSVLKLCRAGYDGRGVMMLRSKDDFVTAFDAPSVIEECVAIRQEISVIVARNEQGEIRCYDAVEMVFNPERFILDFQVCPANISMKEAEEAQALAKRVAEALNLVGIVAVEMFITEGGQILINELAPRPHNSGHHTIEACVTSQYEQLLRAILGLPLGDTRTTAPSVMVNILEAAIDKQATMREGLQSVQALEDAHIHWYGKGGGKEGRKMGHITITAHSAEAAMRKAETIRSLLGNKPHS
jgi:5-(carboxyamino)imidazole ribonucleotide synthase